MCVVRSAWLIRYGSSGLAFLLFLLRRSSHIYHKAKANLLIGTEDRVDDGGFLDLGAHGLGRDVELLLNFEKNYVDKEEFPFMQREIKQKFIESLTMYSIIRWYWGNKEDKVQ